MSSSSVVPLHIVRGSIVAQPSPSSSSSSSPAPLQRVSTPLAARYATTGASPRAPSPLTHLANQLLQSSSPAASASVHQRATTSSPLRQRVTSSLVPSPIQLHHNTSLQSNASPSHSFATSEVVTAKRHASIDLSTRQHLYYVSGGDTAFDVSPQDIHRRRLASLVDALSAEEERNRMALRVDEALVFTELANRREAVDRAAADELSAKRARHLASVRASAAVKREKDLAAAESFEEAAATRTLTPTKSGAHHEAWSAYKEEMKRQGRYTPTRHGPSGQVPIVAREVHHYAKSPATPERGSAMEQQMPRLLDVSIAPMTIEDQLARADPSQVASYLLDRRETFAASVTSAHSMLLLNVARALAAEFAHQVDVRDAAVRQLLLENRALAQKLSDGGASGAAVAASHRSVVETILRRKLAVLQKELDDTTRVASESEAAATALRNRVDVLLAALEEERKTHHARDQVHTHEKEALRSEVISAKAQLKRTQNECEAAHASKFAVEVAVEQLKKDCDAQAESARRAMAELELSLSNAKAEFTASSAKYDRDVVQLRSELDKVAADKTALSISCQELEKQLRLVAGQRDMLTASLSSDGNRLAEMRNESSQLRDLLNKTSAEKESLHAQVKELNARLQQVSTQQAGVMDSNKAHSDRIKALENRNAELQRQTLSDAANSKKEIEKLRNEHEQAIAGLQDAADVARRDAERLRELLAASEAQVQEALAQNQRKTVTVVTPEPSEDKVRALVESATAATTENLQKEKRRTSEQRTALREAFELATKLKVDLPSAAGRDGGTGQVTKRVISTHLQELDAWSVRNGRLLS